MSNITGLDIENQRRSEILEELSISKLWDIINQEDCGTEEELKEILIDFIYNHNINSTTLEEYK